MKEFNGKYLDIVDHLEESNSLQNLLQIHNAQNDISGVTTADHTKHCYSNLII